jgi:hypothetical protein
MGVGNPKSLLQIARLVNLEKLDIYMALGYGTNECGDPSDRRGNTRALLAIAESCSKLHFLDISFNEETIETVATVVAKLPLLNTIVLKACYGGVEYPGLLQAAVKRQGSKVRADFDVVWDRF